MARIVLIFEDEGPDLVFKIEGIGVHEQPETDAEKLAERTLRFVEQMINGNMVPDEYH